MHSTPGFKRGDLVRARFSSPKFALTGEKEYPVVGIYFLPFDNEEYVQVFNDFDESVQVLASRFAIVR
jgi:hypothetical protein